MGSTIFGGKTEDEEGLPMNANDPVRDFLRARGSAEHLIESGLAGLVEGWENIVGAVEAGYMLGLDDYLNDLELRQLLDEAWAVAIPAQRAAYAERIKQADERMKTLVEPLDVSLWGAEVAEEEGWTAQDNWWYYSRPLTGAPDFLAEVDEAIGDA
jgi:hypothetical protein